MNPKLPLYKKKRHLDKNYFKDWDHTKCAFCYKPLQVNQVFTCGFDCQQQIDLRSCPSLLRREIVNRDNYTCQVCGVNIVSLWKAITILKKSKIEDFDLIMRKIAIPKNRTQKPPADADHILPVSKGGGAGIEGDIRLNLQCICLLDHLHKNQEN